MRTPRPVEVAVGVVMRADGAVLLGQRPPGKPYAGWWEFPGGKLEPGESVGQALVRELEEELGIEVRSSHPWVVREFVYPHAHVRLHFRRVFEFAGEPRSREGQAFVWRRADSIGVAPLLPATIPAIGWLRLPPACVKWDARQGAGASCSVAAGNHRIFVLHEPALAPAEFERIFYLARESCRRASAWLLVSSAHAQSFARAADGVLLVGDGLSRCSNRPAGRLAAALCPDRQSLLRAQALALDFSIVPAPPAAGTRPASDGPGALAMPAFARDASLPVYLAVDSAGADPLAALHAGAQGLALSLRR